MILVFGSINMALNLELQQIPHGSDSVTAQNFVLDYGGKAANQALAAARSGAKAALIGKIGNDKFSGEMMRQLRKEGVITSGVAHSDERDTGIIIHMNDTNEEERNIYAPSANLELNADQVPDEVLNNQAFLLIQNEIGPEQNLELLTRAKAHEVTTIMNLSPSIHVNQGILDNLDYLIVNSAEAQKLAQKMKIEALSGSLKKMAYAFAGLGNLTCIITNGAEGSVAATPDGKCWSVGALDIGEIADRSGADDAFSGTFAACKQAGIPTPRALKRASIAASLTCTKKGTQKAFPYLDDIENEMNNLPDPEETRIS